MAEENNDKMKWWQTSVDEMVVALFLAALGVAALLFLSTGGKEVASVCAAGLATYLGGMRSQK